MSSEPEALQARIDVLELELTTAQKALEHGTNVRAPWRERLTEAWRVLRGIVNVGDLRQYAYSEAARADREMTAHSATLQRVEEENKATGAELKRLRAALKKATDAHQFCARDMRDLKTDAQRARDAKDRALEDADKHARMHIETANLWQNRFNQMLKDAENELLMNYTHHRPVGCRFTRVTKYAPGTVLEKRNAANQAIARSIDGGQTWHEVRETVVMAPENPA